MISSKIERITPEMAMEILEKHNPRNRNVVESSVQAYANDMKNKRWTVTHQGLAFNENGDLLDGQHRLWAVVFANMPVDFMVTRGLPDQDVQGGVVINTMDAIDKGRARTTGQNLSLCHGVKNGNQVAACIRGLTHILNHGQDTKAKLSTANTLFIMELYGESASAVVESLATNRRAGHITSPLCMYHKAEPLKAIELCRSLSTLENLTAPTRAWLRYLETQHNSDMTGRALRAGAICIKAYHEQKDIKNIMDGDGGIKFLNSFFPQLNDKIRKAVKSLPGSLVMKKKALKI